MIIAMNAIYAICVKKPEKNSGLQRDLNPLNPIDVLPTSVAS